MMTKSIKDIVADFEKYVVTYKSQANYENYSYETFINDMIYGIGLTINPEIYMWAEGYESFKIDLIEFFKNRQFNRMPKYEYKNFLVKRKIEIDGIFTLVKGVIIKGRIVFDKIFCEKFMYIIFPYHTEESSIKFSCGDFEEIK
jgi:hypothetical protein